MYRVDFEEFSSAADQIQITHPHFHFGVHFFIPGAKYRRKVVNPPKKQKQQKIGAYKKKLPKSNRIEEKKEEIIYVARANLSPCIKNSWYRIQCVAYVFVTCVGFVRRFFPSSNILIRLMPKVNRSGK